MAGRALSGTEARRIARGVRMGAIGLGATAAALWALDIPGLSTAPPAAPAVVETVLQVQGGGAAPSGGANGASAGASAGATAAMPFGSDSALAVATRLEVTRKKAPPPVVVPDKPPQIEVTHEPELVPKDDWRFLGTIRRSDGMKAIVSIEGVQAVIGPGQRFVGREAELVEVTPESITLREGGAERRVGRAQREGSSVGWTKLSGGPPATVPTPGGAPGQGQAGFTPDQQAAMRQRGIDPNQAQRMRDFMRERRRNGDGGGRDANGGGPRRGGGDR